MIIDGYDVDTAIRLLGPADMGNAAPKRPMQKLILLIKEIAVTFLKILNLIFGDHRWYSKAAARRIVWAYLTSDKVEITPEANAKLRSLYGELSQRKLARSSDSYTKGIDFEKLLSERLKRESLIHNNQMANLTLNNLERQYRESGMSESAVREAVYMDARRYKEPSHLLPGISSSAENSTVQELDENAKKWIQHQLETLAPRISLKKTVGFSCKGGLPPDPLYAEIWDPYTLCAVAYQKALDELHERSHLPKDEIEKLHTNAIYQLAVLNLLLQSILELICDGKSHLRINKHLTSTYSPPKLVYEPDIEGLKPRIIYQTELFSSMDIGGDSTGTKNLLNQSSEEDIEKFKSMLLNDSDKQSDILYELIDTMAHQFRLRYGTAISAPIVISEEPPNISAVIEKSFLEEAQKYADHGLITCKDDLWDNNLFLLLSNSVVFTILKNSQLIDQSTLEINPLVRIQCGSYIFLEPSEKHPRILTASTYTHSHPLGEVDNEEYPAGDPIKARKLINELNQAQVIFLEKYVNRNAFYACLKSKGLENSDGILTPHQIYQDFQHLEPSTRNLIQQASFEFMRMGRFLSFKYSQLLRYKIQMELKLRDGPATIAFLQHQEVPIKKTIKEVQSEYLPSYLRTFGSTKEKTIQTGEVKVKVVQSDLYSASVDKKLELLHSQNKIIDNYGKNNNCVARALALGIWGQERVSIENARELGLLRTTPLSNWDRTLTDFFLSTKRVSNKYLFKALSDQIFCGNIFRESILYQVIKQSNCIHIQSEKIKFNFELAKIVLKSDPLYSELFGHVVDTAILEKLKQLLVKPTEEHKNLFNEQIKLFLERGIKKGIHGFIQDPFAAEIKKITANYLLKNASQFGSVIAQFASNAIPHGENFTVEDYCATLVDNAREELSMGSEIEITTISEVFGVPIAIYDPTLPMHVGSIGLERGVIQPTMVIGKEYDAPPLRLVYSNLHCYQIQLDIA